MSDPAERPAPEKPRPRRISELLAAAKIELERKFTDFWLEGELADVKHAASGHVYFTLVEPGAQVRGVMWRGDATRARAKLEDGAKVWLRCSVTIFEERGTFQVVARIALPAGTGDAAAELERLRQKLAAEGLFDPKKKRPLPRVPRTVGVVTSLEGAALSDVLRVAASRMGVRIVVSPSPVQGPDAAPLLVRALRALEAIVDLDVVVIARGGGASEDLAAFNDERVVRAIAACRVPVVSGVGHEVDVTLTDLVADARASTPSNAAELVVPDARALGQELVAASRRVDRGLDRALERVRTRLGAAQQRLGDPGRRIERARQATMAAERRLEQLLRPRIASVRSKVASLAARVDRAEPRARLATQRAGVERTAARLEGVLRERLARLGRERTFLRERIETSGLRLVPDRARALATLGAKLSALSPLAVLGRGYAIALHVPTGRALVRASDVAVGDRLELRLSDGSLEAEVKGRR